MAAKHTAGPWRVALDEPYDAERPTHYLEDAGNHQLMLLARLPEVGPEQHVSNLRLIAAAPELLAAAEMGLWLMRRVAEWEVSGEPITKFAAITHGKQFSEAIAKAKGSESAPGCQVCGEPHGVSVPCGFRRAQP